MRGVRATNEKRSRGAVTAEFAVALPAVVVLMLLALSLTGVVVRSLGCQDAASAVARELAISGLSVDADAMVSRMAGEGATVLVTRDGTGFVVVTTCPSLPGPLGVLPATVKGHAYGLGPSVDIADEASRSDDDASPAEESRAAG
ncbi:pilus assembly protein [uncultured Bifidobacterium sp.]|uniref:pilus assembly protein n=1 Tax=uncultured Bifidobacterium sp. TaxID=165187 RepID=UPI0028DCB3EF|nr:pilus assembly protein [uncultured Bifidobacterium sp.]